MKKTDFEYAVLQMANFADANAEGADFSKSVLHDVKFDNTNLKNANFKGADLTSGMTETYAHIGSTGSQSIRCKFLTDAGAIIDGTTKCVR